MDAGSESISSSPGDPYGLYEASEPPAITVLGNFGVTDNQVSDSQLFTALWFNTVLGAICFVAFCFLQRSAFPRHYRHRLISPSVTVKPRSLPTKGWASLWQWLINAIVTPENEILSSAGLDALVMTWSLKIGISLFLPMAVVGCSVLIPLHYIGFKSNTKLQQDTSIKTNQLMRLTIAALPNGSQQLWLHFALVVIYNIYAMCILFWHFRQYVIIRQTYLTRGDDPNYWMALTHQADAKSISKKVKKMLQDLNLASDKQEEPRETSEGGAARTDDGATLLSAFAREGAGRSGSVMSSLRGLGAGISKFFTTASLMGSRAPSTTPPASELTTLTTNSMVGVNPAMGPTPGVAWGPGTQPTGTPPNAGASSGGGSSNANAAASGAAAQHGSVSSVLGVSPAALATRMRLLRNPLPGAVVGPVTAPPPTQEMMAGANSAAGTAAESAAAAAAGLSGAAALAAHHHYRVAHMRTITEENLDLLLRPGSSGGLVDMSMSGSIPASATAAGAAAAGAAGPFGAVNCSRSPSPPPRQRAELLGSMAESGGGSSDEDDELAGTRRGSDVDAALAASATSPFASCGALAGRIVQNGIAADGGASAMLNSGSSTASGGTAAAACAAAATAASAGHDPSAPLPCVLAPTLAACSRGVPPMPTALAVSGAAAGAQVGAGDVLARYSIPTAPEDLRLLMGMRSSQGDSSAGGGASEGGDGMEGVDAWPADAAPLGPFAGPEGRRVAYHWWKALPEDSLQKADSMSASDLDGYEGWREQPLLAKPSVRFRKTINADNPAYKPYGTRCNPNERAKVAVNAQHYAILVTDVTQWPYPELQREYEAIYKPTMTERLLQWLGHLPQIVSRPGVALCGDSDSSVEGVALPVPIAQSVPVGSKRSMELSQAEQQQHHHGSIELSPHVTDNLEAAVETIENAKAKLQMLTISSSDDSNVLERASKTLKRIAKAERHVSRLAEQRERTVALSREHSQMHLAMSRAPVGGSCGGPGSTTGGGGGSGGSVGGTGPGSTAGGAGARGSLGAAPSRIASIRSFKMSDAQILRAESAVAGAAVGAGAPVVGASAACSSPNYSSMALASLPQMLGGAGSSAGAVMAGTSSLGGHSQGRWTAAVSHGRELGERSKRATAYLDPEASGSHAVSAGAPLHTASSGSEPCSGGGSGAPGSSGGGTAGSGGGASSSAGHRRGPSPPSHLHLMVPPNGSPLPPRTSSPHSVSAGLIRAHGRASPSPLASGSSGGGTRELLRRHNTDLRSARSETSTDSGSFAADLPGSGSRSATASPISRHLGDGGSGGGSDAARTVAMQQLPWRHIPDGENLPVPWHSSCLVRRRSEGSGMAAATELRSTHSGRLLHGGSGARAVGVAVAAPPPSPYVTSGGGVPIVDVIADSSIGAAASRGGPGSDGEDEGDMEHPSDGSLVALVPPDSARSEEAGTIAAQHSSRSLPDYRLSLGSLPPIEPATSPRLVGSRALGRPNIATKLRGILRNSGGAGGSGNGDGGQHRRLKGGRRSGLGVRQRLKGVMRDRPQLEMQLLSSKQPSHYQQDDEDEPAMIKAAVMEAVGDGKQRGASRAARRWGLVRKALESGRLLRLPYDANNYSIVTSTFKRLFPRDYDGAIPVINHKEVDKLLMQWEASVARLERAELTRIRTGQEPMKRIGCCGDLVEVIPTLQEEILDLEQRIEAERRRAWNTDFTPSWFVFFRSQQAAAMAASTQIYGEDTAKFQVHPAPGPEEVNWQHLWLTWRQRDLRGVLTWPLLVAVVVFPITLITSAVAQLQYVLCPPVKESTDGSSRLSEALLWPWYCHGGTVIANFIRSLITGWLPALLLNLWLVLVLPRLVYLLVQSEGNSFSLSALERRIGVVFFYWDVFNVFLQGVIGSTFFQRVQQIIYHPENLPNILGAALPNSSNFFIQFISMRALFLVWLRMCVPHGGVWQNWCHYLCCPPSHCSFCNTDRDMSLTYGPRTPRYGFELGHVLLIYLLALTFSVVAPLLLPFSVIWFVFAWVQWRHNLCYVYQRKYESGGLMWTYMFSRICICLVIMQLFTFCVLAFKGAYVQAFLIVAFMPALTMKFHRNCQRRFGRGVENVPLELASRAPRGRVPPLVYIPPPLQDKSWGWYPEWNKIWDGWGMPTGYQIPSHRNRASAAAAAAAAATAAKRNA